MKILIDKKKIIIEPEADEELSLTELGDGKFGVIVHSNHNAE